MLKFHLEKRMQNGNRIRVMRDGEAFFSNLCEKIREAKHEVLIETFILEDDEVGKQLQNEIISAARRNVKVILTVDGWGSYFLPKEYINSLVDAGAIVQIYDPQPKWLKGRPKLVNRLHRKLVVIDGHTAYVGGINLCSDHLTQNNSQGKRDFVAELQGPTVSEVRKLCVLNIDKEHRSLLTNLPEPKKTNGDKVKAAFVFRDNLRHSTDIEKAYLEKIHSAKRRILIANAYVFPSYRLIRSLRKAARRGVEVKLITQGKPDLSYTLAAAHSIYKKLIEDRVEMYEYMERPLHAKIAVIDDDWCTIGSSNLDPWSLGSNLEANLFIKDEGVTRTVDSHISDLIDDSKHIDMSWVEKRPIVGSVRDTILYHMARWWPTITNCLPKERQKNKCFSKFKESGAA